MYLLKYNIRGIEHIFRIIRNKLGRNTLHKLITHKKKRLQSSKKN